MILRTVNWASGRQVPSSREHASRQGEIGITEEVSYCGDLEAVWSTVTSSKGNYQHDRRVPSFLLFFRDKHIPTETKPFQPVHRLESPIGRHLRHREPHGKKPGRLNILVGVDCERGKATFSVERR